ncbi:hypothetical protein DFH09DRAFT_1041938 [Mycena vulgaris]|nr:hypothetical protein DFH09DRAFT_1041938 [Mycena vulgaris]
MSVSTTMASPFAQKLGTNYCPDDAEIPQIKALLVEPALRLERLEGEITDMQKAFDKMIEERESLIAYMDSHKTLLSPIRRLPLDAIQEIFMACMPTDRNCVMSAREAPVLLSRICSSWRAISLSTPRLWARLHIVEPAEPSHWERIPHEVVEAKVVQRVEMTKTWLSRSGQCPLSISLECGPDKPRRNSPFYTGRFLRALIPFASRWQHIHFTVPPLELRGLSEVDAPILESLSLYQRTRHQIRLPIEWERFGMLRAPRLSSFTITGSNFILTELSLPWTQLTTLSMLTYPRKEFVDGLYEATVAAEAALQIISKCPELRTCRRRVSYHSGRPDGTPRSIVEHPSLSTLELCTDSTAWTFKDLLGHLSLPELRDFIYRVETNRTEYPFSSEADNGISALGGFLAASTHLEGLELDNSAFLKSSLKEILRSLPPSTQRLHIHDFSTGRRGSEVPSSFDDEVLAFLTPPPTAAAPDCCPALQELHLYNPRTISDVALLRLIISRTADGPRSSLKRVKVMFSRVMMDDILPDLQPSIADGLDVHISHSLPYPHSYQSSPWLGLADDPAEYQ